MLSRLGEGGMGTVYLCEHAVLRRRFAVKVLRPDLVSDAELADRFRNEAIAASRIGQENVVDVVDFGADEDGALYYVMEALDGRSLGAVIEAEGPLPLARALDLLEQVCRALGAAHARGVVHRDVKPDNVFLVRRPDGAEQVKVIDFGISHVPSSGGRARLTRAGAIIGTPEYMAPEQAVGEPIDLRADVYAAGVLLFEMLTGQLPIEAATPMATLVAHQTRTPDPPSRRVGGIPPGVDALVLRAMAKRPEDRFASMEALAAEAARLRAAVTPASGSAHGSRSQTRPRGHTVALPAAPDEDRRGARRVRVAVAATALVTALVTLAAVWTAAGREAAPASTASAASTPTSLAHDDARAAPLAAPVLVEDTGGARPIAAVTAEPPRPARSVARRPAPRPAAAGARADELKDPYGSAGALKDPFE